MSDLHRSVMAARIAQLPPMPPPVVDDDEEMEEEENDALGSLPSSQVDPSKRTRDPRSQNDTQDLSPMSAAAYFTQAVEVEVPQSGLVFRVYFTSPRQANGTIFVFHHGAGYSALSFALLAREIVERTEGECGVLAIDARRHGRTTTMRGVTSDSNLGIGVLTQDFVNVLTNLFADSSPLPTLLLVGHSMGGAVVTRACPTLMDRKFPITGAVVLDVVEGSALEALPYMHKLLDSRPNGFDSLQDAIAWHLNNNTIRNRDSARISVPALMTPSNDPQSGAPSASRDKDHVHSFVWRTPLRSTEAYWTSWFKGLSSSFLSTRTARLLILAGTDRLDKELMIGQMQGKFQMNVVPGVGHMLHEDDPKQIADILVKFWRRNERLAVGVRKVGEA